MPKLFTDERQMKVQIFLDTSASMGKDNPQKAAYALACAAGIGYLAIHNMDKVSFNIMKENVCENINGTIIGKNQFFKAVKTLEDLKFENEVDLEKCILNCNDDGTANGIAVIISDFMTDTDWKKAVDFLKYKKRQVLLLQILTPEEEDPSYIGRVNLIDSESLDIADTKNMRVKINSVMQQAYAEALADFKKDISEFCKKRDVDYITVNTGTPVESVLFKEMLKVGLMS